MRRTASKALALPLALVFLLSGCSDRRSEPPKEEKPSARDVSGFLPGHGPDAPGWSPGVSAPSGEGLSRPMPKGPADILSSRGQIAGTVTLAQGAAAPKGAMLYVFAKRPGQQGPPVAAARIPNPKFPQPFRIGASDVIAGSLEGDLDIGAQLDVDGNAGTQEPENLTGEYARNPVRAGHSGVAITIARAPSPSPSPFAAAPLAPAEVPERGASLSGTIRLAPGTKAPPRGVLYVIAREGSHPSAPPFAVKRIDASSFPVPYVLSVGDAMAPDAVFSGPVSVTARLDADGNASTKEPDDLVGRFDRNPAHVGDTDVDITLGPAPPQNGPSLPGGWPSLLSGPPGSESPAGNP